MLKLTYIIPVYNGEKTISRTLNSIYSTGLPEDEFEIILVDDCSKDHTILVIEEYAKNHQNICILQQPTNQKQGMARNRAIPLAQGEYITFVDADDRVEKGMRIALEEARANNVDLLMGQTRYQNIIGEYTDLYLCQENNIINGRELLNKHYHWHLPGAPWGYLFKASYIQNNEIRFIPERFNEDADWILKQIYYADSIKVCNDTIYTYVETVGSTVHTVNASRYADSLHADYRILRFANEKNIEAPRFAKECIEDRTYSVDGKMRRLWKLNDRKYNTFYTRLTDDARMYLAKNIIATSCRFDTMFLLRHKKLSLVALYIIAGPLSIIRTIIRNNH